ncbi:wsv092 [White spot syndrome virus]|uniref:Wsv092 n=4 Tax=White spot syndrome virus TaxID=342409 RepID=Q8VB91_WSSVS|nr:wsv092 [Shrimp white spot syndrome virus]AFX59469.1 wsv092 [White spot syndrome virus]AAL33096.1 wsv092 [Shrimp white spot syndrome virus]AWQ60279.1 wsv092 [Shrimp white spot syndrome virus]AWQ60695.1 wsv092 [Shrimp white spot syndrome virus]AWQ61123.1 wsv092 [Shrimp white spot syndrome virus]
MLLLLLEVEGLLLLLTTVDGTLLLLLGATSSDPKTTCPNNWLSTFTLDTLVTKNLNTWIINRVQTKTVLETGELLLLEPLPHSSSKLHTF